MNRKSTPFWIKGIIAVGIGLVCCFTMDRSAQADSSLGAPVFASPVPGNLMIYRVGDGTVALANTGNPVFVDEYTTSGTLVQSIAMPISTVGANRELVANGTATSEGFLALSADNQYLMLVGYAATIPYASNLATTSSATVPRTVGRIDVNGNIDTTTALTDFASGSNPRSAASTNGTDIWVAGGAGGVRYLTLGSTTSTQLATAPTNVRVAKIGQGQLYISSASGTYIGVNTVGIGAPTTTGQTVSLLPGLPGTGSPYSYYLADLDAGVAGYDTLYLADDGAPALTKYSLVGGNWTSNGIVGVNADDYRGLTGVRSGSSVTLYATRLGGSGGTGGGELVTLIDSSGYNGAFTGTPTVLATAATNTAFRGVAFAPGTSPTAITLREIKAAPSSSPIIWPVLAVSIILLSVTIILRRRSRAA
jgi:hypothetical protein